jgi:hypothetical protein
VRANATFASAMREAHAAKTSPARAKTTKTEVRALVTVERGRVEVGGVVVAGTGGVLRVSSCSAEVRRRRGHRVVR